MMATLHASLVDVDDDAYNTLVLQEDLLQSIRRRYVKEEDGVLKELIKAKVNGLCCISYDLIYGSYRLRIKLVDCEIKDDLLYVNDRVFISNVD